MRIIGYKAIVPQSVVETIEKTMANPYAAGSRFFSEASDMSGIAYEPIYEKANKNVFAAEFFNPLSPIGVEKEAHGQIIDFIF